MNNIQTQETITYDASVALAMAASAQTTLNDATAFVIDSQTMFDLAAADLRQIKARQKMVEEKRTSITGPLNQAVKAVNDLFRPASEFLVKAESILKRSLLSWTVEQERLAVEARRKAEEEARAERERLAHEEAAAKEAARRAEAEAKAAAKAGDIEAAIKANQAAYDAEQQAQAAAMTATVLTIPPKVDAPAKVAGISGRMNYSAEVVDIIALANAVAIGEAPVQCIQPNMQFLGAQARAYKKPGQLFPGVEVRAERSLAAARAM